MNRSSQLKWILAGAALGALLIPAAAQAAEPAQAEGQDSAAAAAAADTAATGDSELLARIAALEARLAQLEKPADPEAGEDGEDCEEPEPDEDAVDVKMFGDFQLQGQWFETGGGESQGSVSDFDLYYGEFGWDIACKDSWSGHFSLNVDDDDDTVTLYEAWGRYQHPDNGFFAQMGQIALPFADTNSYFPTYSATNDLGITTAKGIGIGVEQERYGLSAWLVNPDVEVYGNMLPDDDESSRKKLDEYCLWWDVSKREADECHDGHRFSLGYISHLGNHDFGVVESPVSGRVPGINVFGQYDWDANRWHALAEYTGATQAFDAADLDANADELGDQPAAWNFELAHNPGELDTWALGYQHSSEFVDHATNRYALMYGRQLCDIAELRLELSHGKYGDYVSDGRDEDTSFVAEFHVSF
ncbi:hypothetical protein IT575_07940 [bacterium]|nr:hypothetical protein [bacterium]